jgi:TolB-like protein/Tfp pilus assembly protein PilF
MRTDEETEAFTTGVHDDIVTQLSKVSALKVMSRTSVLEYRNTTKNIRQIGEELGVANLLEGGVQRAGSQIRINVQLIDARSDQHLWADTYNREWTVENVFAVQSDIARQVARALEAALLPEERASIEERPTDNAEAYEAFLLANTYAQRTREREATDRAMELYERAVELDPGFAAAWALLGRQRIWEYWEWNDFEQQPRAEAALDRAVQLAPDGADTHFALGFYHYYYGRDYDTALEHFFAAERLRPGRAVVLGAIGLVRRRQGRWEEAVTAWKRALEADPRSPWLNLVIGESNRFMRRYDEAARYLDRTISVAPEDQTSYSERFATLLYLAADSVAARRFLDEHTNQIVDAQLHTGYRSLAYYQNDLRRVLQLSLEHLPAGYRMIALAGHLLGDAELAEAYADSLRSRGERRLQQVPERLRSVPYRTVLAPHLDISMADALLGREQEAIAGAQRALELLPMSRDAMRGLDAVWNLARVYAIFGYEDEVLDQLEYLLSIPSFWTPWQFRNDPLLSYLADNPRLQRLVGRD